ncbi:M48 family metallopeptidase [Guyparkeria halophila]|uniref:M48 family metallopeptidase n=1 Tax=Guyparkeria halophila TaxID=47960 RepID=A0ABZ0YVS1_9GAMM|nr:M48 family metallopeptidase [Guyparkeria halophila]WQH15469.1 M48 family metallopeptidase [Guyparkeria halophila]
MRLPFVVSVLGLSLVVAGCATHPVTGRSQLMIMPEGQANQMAYQAYTQMAREKSTLPASDPASQRVQRITQRIVPQAVRVYPQASDWRWESRVFRDDSINAFAMAGGKVGINTGMLNKLRPTDDELAQVIAHEVAHALSGHTREKMSMAMTQQMGLSVASALGGLDSQTAAMAQQVATVAIDLPFSRRMELEADEVGLLLAARAGYDPRAAVSLWRKMQANGGGGGPEWLSTHPDSGSRIQALERAIPRVMPEYRRATGR